MTEGGCRLFKKKSKEQFGAGQLLLAYNAECWDFLKQMKRQDVNGYDLLLNSETIDK
jgi:hypothetical protein